MTSSGHAMAITFSSSRDMTLASVTVVAEWLHQLSGAGLFAEWHQRGSRHGLASWVRRPQSCSHRSNV